jgi:hypothetical protein
MGKEQTNKKDTVARRWILTLPATEYGKAEVEKQLKSYNYVGQLERGESGYEHWQIYIDNRGKGNIRFSTLRSKFPKGHYEQAKGSPAECVTYVTKVETSLGVAIKNGEINVDEKPVGNAAIMSRAHTMIVEEGKTVDDVYEELAGGFGNAKAIQEIQAFAHRKKAKEIARAGGMDRKVHFITGAPGVGKTSMVYKNHADELYSASTYSNPFDEYQAEKVLLLDEFAGQIEFELMLKLLDRYPVSLPARYQNKLALYEEVYLLSNLRLDHLYPEIQRHSPRQWNAFLRRIDNYQEMLPDGSLVDLEKPVAVHAA